MSKTYTTFEEAYHKGVKAGRKSASEALEAEIEMLQSTINGMMEDRRFEAAKAAMQGLLANPNITTIQEGKTKDGHMVCCVGSRQVDLHTEATRLANHQLESLNQRPEG